MFELYRKWDDILIKTKPHLWLVQFHLFAPVSLLLLAIAVCYAVFTPMQINQLDFYLYFSHVGINSLVLSKALAHQFKFISDSLTIQHHRSVYLIKISFFIVFMLNALLPPYIIIHRVSYCFGGEKTSYFKQKVRVAMLKSKYIDYIKTGFMPEGRTDIERELSDNKFIFQEPFPRKFLYVKARRIKKNSKLSVDLQLNVVISATVASNMDSSAESYKANTSDNRDDIKSFFKRVRSMSYEDIASVKSQVKEVLLENNLKLYVGDSISTGLVPQNGNIFQFSASTINQYHTYLYSEIETLEKIGNLEIFCLPLAFAILFVGIFTYHMDLPVTFQLRSKYNSDFNKSRHRYSFIASMLYGIIMTALIGYTFLYSYVTDLYSEVDPVLSAVAVLLGVVLFLNRLMARKRNYKIYDFSVFLINYFLLPVVLVLAAYILIQLIGVSKSETGWLAFFSILLLPVLDYVLIIKCHLLANLPELE